MSKCKYRSLSFLLILFFSCSTYAITFHKKNRGNDVSNVKKTYKIGDSYYRDFGALYVEKNGSKYFIAFPIVSYYDYHKNFKNFIDDTVINSIAKFIVVLNNEDTLSMPLQNDVRFTWFYWQHYMRPRYAKRSNSISVPAPKVRYKNNVPIGPYTINKDDLYALTWNLKFEIAADQAALLKKYNIRCAYVADNGKQLQLSIKPNQARRLKKIFRAIYYS